MHSEMDGQNVELLWQKYRNRPNDLLRNKLIEHYSFLSRIIAAKLYARRLDDDVDFEEYLQFGMVGLIESIDRYLPERGASFATFAQYRIRGAILNGISKMSERREQYAYRTRRHKERINSITETEGLNKEELSLFDEMVEFALGIAICYMLEGTGLVQENSNSTIDTLYHTHELSLLKERLVESIERLPEKERLVIQHHYFKHDSFKRIAEKIGVSKGRVSQIHKRALQLLRKALAEQHLFDDYY